MIKQPILLFGHAQNSSSYQCSLSRLGCCRKIITIKYDPGASNTIITANLLGFDETSIAKLRDYIEKRDFPKKQFKAANDTELYGYLVEAANVKLGSLELPVFQYFIIPTTDYIKALLGNDFLDYCELHKSVLSEVCVTGFDYDQYQRSFGDAADRFSQDDLDSLLDWSRYSAPNDRTNHVDEYMKEMRSGDRI